jgi:feruloyl esterase
MRILRALFVAAVVSVVSLHGAVPDAQIHQPAVSCARLASLSLPNTTITATEVLGAGSGRQGRGAYEDLPSFCRVAATLAPSSDSDIKVEVWLPLTTWNGKLQGVGNGGWSGSINTGALVAAVRRGYAAASTDTGHQGGSGQFALGHPEKLIDFGYRAVHEMTVQAKAIVAAFYGQGARLSYWVGCSSGGKQGLKEAQKFPADYDGIVAGAPANYWTHLTTQSLWVANATLKEPASHIPREKFAMMNRAVMAACDLNDKVRDNVIEDPSRCRFDPGVLACKAGDGPECLTAPQVEAARKIYAPATNPRTRAEIFPGLAIGSENGWQALAGGPNPLSIATDHFKYVVFKDPNWDFRTLDFDRHVALADKIDNGLLNANDPNLGPFFARGGKLLMYHGWNDQLIAPQNTINYYNSVLKAAGANAGDSMRLFMAPGMAHCSGGNGPNTFDMVGALEEWIEQRRAPERIVATLQPGNGVPGRSRPLCAYPRVAQYSGSGSTDEERNFSCKTP